MNMRILPFIILFAACFGPASSVCTQPLLSKEARRIVGSFVRVSPKVSSAHIQQLHNMAAKVATQNRMEPLRIGTEKVLSLESPKPLPPININRSVFTLSSHPESKHKGSAFAIEIDGKVWGVTARHVMDDVGRSGYMEILNDELVPQFGPIIPSVEGHIDGADIALFEIPENLKSFLHPLQPQENLPLDVYTPLSSAGFGHGNFTWLTDRNVLFSSEHRILMQDVPFSNRSGYCGSPLLLDGKVVGVHMKTWNGNTTPEWKGKTVGKDFEIQSFTQAVPVSWITRLARQAQGEKSLGALLRFNGSPIGFLAPNETITSIVQIRQDRLLKTIPAYPFMDYSFLERFFTIEEGDVFRINIQKGDRISSSQKNFWYEYTWNSTTGGSSKKVNP